MKEESQVYFLQKETICNNINMLSKYRQAKLHAKVMQNFTSPLKGLVR